jgi:HSP20 family protein
MLRRRYIPNMWDEMNRLQREMNSLFDHYDRPWSQVAGYPAVNVWMNDESAVITAELPGVDVKDLDISVVGETVTLSGERKSDDLPKDVTYHRQERGTGKFTRTIDLPFTVESGKVQATLEKGILRVLLPRSEKDKPRKVMVKAVS